MSRGRSGKDGRSMQVVHVQVCDAARRVSERRIVLKIPRGSRLVRVRLPPPAPATRSPSRTCGDRSAGQCRARRGPWGNRGAIRGEATRLAEVGRLRSDRPVVRAASRSWHAGQRDEARDQGRDGAAGPPALQPASDAATGRFKAQRQCGATGCQTAERCHSGRSHFARPHGRPSQTPPTRQAQWWTSDECAAPSQGACSPPRPRRCRSSRWRGPRPVSCVSAHRSSAHAPRTHRWRLGQCDAGSP